MGGGLKSKRILERRRRPACGGSERNCRSITPAVEAGEEVISNFLTFAVAAELLSGSAYITAVELNILMFLAPAGTVD